MQVIGLCRFSYPAIGGFQVEHETTAERERFLYAHDRMEERFRLFETIALPGLRNQSDPEFDLIIVTGDSLPRVHLDRLRDLTAGMKQVQIIREPSGPHRQVMKTILNAARRDPEKPCLQFRQDDDDAVSKRFVERLRRTAQDCAGLLKHRDAAAIDFTRGCIAEPGAKGIFAVEQVRPLVTAALGMYVRGGSRLTIMNFAHHKIGRFMPVISLSDEPMWIRTHNRYNDSRQKKVAPMALSPLSAEQEQAFHAHFSINVGKVRQAFSGS